MLSAREMIEKLTARNPFIDFVEHYAWEPGRKISRHTHAEAYQLDLFTAGEGTYAAEEKLKITPQHLFLAPPDWAHEITSSRQQPLVGLSVKFRHPGARGQFLPVAMRPARAVRDQAENLLRQTVAEAIFETAEHRLVAALRLTELLVLLLHHHAEPVEEASAGSLAAAAAEYLRRHFSEKLSLERLASAMRVSRAHLCREFRRERDQTPLEYLRGLRVEFARERLLETDSTITEIARAAGFVGAADFNRAFQTNFGQSPRQYRHQEKAAKS